MERRIKYLFEEFAVDVVIRQRAPQLASLVREAGEAITDDDVDIQQGHLVWVLGDEVTQL